VEPPPSIVVPGFVQRQARRSGAPRYAARLGRSDTRTVNVGTFGTRERAEEELAMAKARIAADLTRRLARRGHVGNGYAPVGFLLDDERRAQVVEGYEVRVESRRT
jgi:hypothetical protein